jgi:hypothetical protein
MIASHNIQIDATLGFSSSTLILRALARQIPISRVTGQVPGLPKARADLGMGQHR